MPLNCSCSIVTRAEQDQISELVEAETVALRLATGSQEVVFLSSFCPLEGVPTVVLIKYIQTQLLPQKYCLRVLQKWCGPAAHLG
jgi:hypothetical protein